MTCSTCSLWRKCSLYREGSVCTVGGTNGRRLAEQFRSRNAAAPATAEKVSDIISDTAQLSRTGLIRVRRTELHKPRRAGCAGIGLIEIQRKTAIPVTCVITPLSVGESIVEITATLRK